MQVDYPIRCRTYKETPLGEEVGYKNKVVAVWNRIHETMPCENEVGKDEKHSSYSIQTASLQERAHEHKRNQDRIYTASDTLNSMRSLRDDLGKCNCKKSRNTDGKHRKVSFGTGRQLPVMLDFCKVAFRKEPYIKGMSCRKEPHLCYKIAACAEPVAEGREEQSRTYLPWGQPQRRDKKCRNRKYKFMRNLYRDKEQHCKGKEHSSRSKGSGFRCHRLQLIQMAFRYCVSMLLRVVDTLRTAGFCTKEGCRSLQGKV